VEGADACHVGPTGAPSPKGKRRSGSCMREPTCDRENVRLEFMVKFRLSVEAIGRRDWNSSARLKAGMVGVKVCGGVGAEAMEPSEERRVASRNELKTMGIYEDENEGTLTTLCTISPLHNRMSSYRAAIFVPHRLAKTAREHIQTHTSGWHYPQVLLLYIIWWFRRVM
jgi:hypothetical protein